jgi:hypothetical protein
MDESRDAVFEVESQQVGHVPTERRWADQTSCRSADSPAGAIVFLYGRIVALAFTHSPVTSCSVWKYASIRAW